MTLRDYWDSFRLIYLKREDPVEHHVLARRAFYMGAANVLMFLTEVGELPMEEGEKLLEKLWKEALEFKRQVEDGKA